LSWHRLSCWPERSRAETAPPSIGELHGFWAYKRRDSAVDHLLGRNLSGDSFAGAVGRVSLWGRYVEAEGGYRAQYAYPFELFLFRQGWPYDPVLAGLVRERYAVDVSQLQLTAHDESRHCKHRAERDEWMLAVHRRAEEQRAEQRLFEERRKGIMDEERARRRECSAPDHLDRRAMATGLGPYWPRNPTTTRATRLSRP
jgi:hypothetical protein